MTSIKNERKKNPEYWSDDYGPIRAGKFMNPPHRPGLSRKNDEEIYGKLGTIDPMMSISATAVVGQYSKLGMSLSRQRNLGPEGVSENRVVSTKCKGGHCKNCFGCAHGCHQINGEKA